jgi:hypothetical protein
MDSVEVDQCTLGLRTKSLEIVEIEHIEMTLYGLNDLKFNLH